jgi:hypothetical protein
MKFIAATLFAVASASYAAAEQAEPRLLNWTKSWTSDYKKIDVDAIVTELNRRNEIAVRAVRDETFATTQGLTEEHRNAVDQLIAVFEGDILALREAIQASRDAKRAEIADANAAIRSVQDDQVADLIETLAALNDAQETLLAEILLADMYYDHTRIAKLLDVDGKGTALTWEEDGRPAAATVADSYLSWNAREPAERHYNEYYTAEVQAPVKEKTYGHGYGQGYGHGYGGYGHGYGY